MKLKLNQISYSVKSKKILTGVDLELRAGQTTVVLGPNGAGKSSLIKILSGYLQPSSGEVLIDGQAVAAHSLAQRAQKIAVLTQRSSLDFPFTAREVIQMGRTPFGITDDRHGVADELLDVFGISGGQSYISMSGGEQQLVQLARVFAQIWGRGEDVFLLLDEPMTALDLRHQALVARLLEEKSQEGTGQLVVMHDINLAAEIADQIILMSSGQIVALGSVDETLTVDNLEKTFNTPILRIGEGSMRFYRASLR